MNLRGVLAGMQFPGLWSIKRYVAATGDCDYRPLWIRAYLQLHRICVFGRLCEADLQVSGNRSEGLRLLPLDLSQRFSRDGLAAAETGVVPKWMMGGRVDCSPRSFSRFVLALQRRDMRA